MKKMTALLFLFVTTNSFATSYWYDYCFPMKEVYSFVSNKYPSEVFAKDRYDRCGIDCEMRFKQNLFGTKATFNISVFSSTHQKYDFKVVYKVNTRNDGKGICRLVEFKHFSE